MIKPHRGRHRKPSGVAADSQSSGRQRQRMTTVGMSRSSSRTTVLAMLVAIGMALLQIQMGMFYASSCNEFAQEIHIPATVTDIDQVVLKGGHSQQWQEQYQEQKREQWQEATWDLCHRSLCQSVLELHKQKLPEFKKKKSGHVGNVVDDEGGGRLEGSSLLLLRVRLTSNESL